VADSATTNPASGNGFGETFQIGGDLPVRRIGLGAMRLADDPRSRRNPRQAVIWRPPTDPDSARAVLRRAVELGVTLIDTADAYSLGGNEELIARALHPYPEELVIATKVGATRPNPTEWVPLGRPEYLRQQVELGLRRLRVERIDLLQLHRVDPRVPLVEQVGALRQLREAGKIRHIGLSEVTVAQLREALTVAPIASVQNLYHLTARQYEEVLDFCTSRGIGFLPFFPLAAGGHAAGSGTIARVAAAVGATPAQVALAWLLHRSPVTIPIPGTTSAGHVQENLDALAVRLSEEQFTQLGQMDNDGV
jgi:pyridoxine 4-dehydrogenase